MTYKITYQKKEDQNDKVVRRIADNAQDALEKLCNQYGWGYKLTMYDADTRGAEWAQFYIDPTGGINYEFLALAERDE